MSQRNIVSKFIINEATDFEENKKGKYDLY